MDADIERLRGLPDPLERAREAGELQSRLLTASKEVSRIRREAVEDLLRSGMSQANVAAALGMSRGRVSQMVSSGPPPERAFFGDDTLTVTVGGKLEAGKVNPGPAVAQEDFVAFERMKELAAPLQLDATFEVIHAPDIIKLNRSNLVVICGPRLQPVLEQILESDPVLGFARDEHGWYLQDRETTTIYRSPRDSGTPGDVAYFGRLPRPDGRGSFVYMAGIHAPGPLGVIHHLHQELADMYREIRTRRFSCLVECRYDPSTFEVQSSQRITPLYRHEGGS